MNINIKNEIIIGLLCVFIFLITTLYVIFCTPIHGYEIKIINFVQNSLKAVPTYVPLFLSDFTYGNPRNIIFIISLILFIFYKKYKYALILIITEPIAAHLYSYMKVIIARPRPPIEYRLDVVHNYSFPSGHSFMSIVFYGLLIYFILKSIKNKKIKLILVSILSFIIISVGFSRIWLGVHYPTDVIGGYSLGIIYIMFFIMIDKLYLKDDTL